MGLLKNEETPEILLIDTFIITEKKGYYHEI